MSNGTCIPVECVVPNGEIPHSPRVALVRSLFGLNSVSPTIVNPVTQVPQQGVTLILGPSGCGKSTLLDRIRALHPEVTESPPDPPADQALIDVFALPFDESLNLLGRCGLAEAKLLCRPFGVLSAGQKARARIALLMQHRPKTIIIDEFLNELDRLSARIVAFNLGRLCRHYGVTSYLASGTADDLIEALGPDHVIRFDADGLPHTARCEGGAFPPDRDLLWVGPGTRHDYAALAQYHYLDAHADLGWTDNVRRIRVVRHRNRPIGIVVTGMPFSRILNRIEFFAELNARVEIGLRTIVHPQFRGIGLTHLLELQAEERLELRINISAMARYVPFLRSAGALPIELPRNTRTAAHDELEAWVTHRGVLRVETLHDVAIAEQFVTSLDPSDRESLKSQCTRILSRMNAEFAMFLAELLGMRTGGNAQLATLIRLYERLFARVQDRELAVFLDEALYFPVQGSLTRYHHRRAHV